MMYDSVNKLDRLIAETHVVCAYKHQGGRLKLSIHGFKIGGQKLKYASSKECKMMPSGHPGKEIKYSAPVKVGTSFQRSCGLMASMNLSNLTSVE